MKTITVLSLATLCLAGCATHEQTFWDKGKKGTVIVHHVRKTHQGISDRTETLTAKVVTPTIVHVYDLGRMPNGHGGVDEAHRFYQVVESSHFDLRLPEVSKLKPNGPRTVYTSPNYSPPPRDQRINDAVAEARQAKDRLDEARGKVEQQLTTDNNLRGALQDQIDENARLQEQLNAAMSAQHSAAPPVGPQSDKAGQQGGPDALATWGAKLQQ